jgi:hypothetical protein
MGLASCAVSADYFRGLQEHEPHAADAAGHCGGWDMGQEHSLHALPVVECPGCRTEMQVVGTEPAPNDQHSVTYRCNRCGTETVRVFKIPDEYQWRAVTRPVAPSPARSRHARNKAYANWIGHHADDRYCRGRFLEHEKQTGTS